MTSDQHPSRPVPGAGAWPRLDRRSLLRLWSAALAGAFIRRPPRVASSALGAVPAAGPLLAADQGTSLTIKSESAQLRLRFDPRAGSFGVAHLASYDTAWVPDDVSAVGALWIDSVQVNGGPPVTVDGSGGLELVTSSRTSVTLFHSGTGLRIALEYATAPGSAILHRVTLTNAGSDDVYIGSAATLALPLRAGDWTEALAADDAPDGWTMLRQDLPASYGNHELRNATGGVYPLVRLVTAGGDGVIVAVSTATAWRVEVLTVGEQRLLQAGEYQSDLTLGPGEQARLPDVVTIFYSDGPDGAVDALRRYLQSVSAPPPAGWDPTPPAVFNTWFGYGTALIDDGTGASELRRAARVAADAGLEVMVVDAGWYLGNPIPDEVGDRGQRASSGGQSRRVGAPALDDSGDGRLPPAAPYTADDFSTGLGTWVENPSKWLAGPGTDGNKSAGLRNFSDFVHSLSVRRPDGTVTGKMRFGLWVEPERFDPGNGDPKRVPSDWALPGTPILDFSRPEVVDGITARIQRAITDYGVDYLKVDANMDVVFDPDLGRTGHLWTRWSAGFERLLENLRRANPGLYLEHSASGLKRYWTGLPRLVHSTWLDDDVDVDNVGRLLDATDALMLPRQKTALVTEDLSEFTGERAEAQIAEVISAYWGSDHRNGGTIGFSSRLDRWSPEQQRAAAEALETWKQDVRARRDASAGES